MNFSNLIKKKIILLSDLNKELNFLSNDRSRILISGGSSLDKIYKLANLKTCDRIFEMKESTKEKIPIYFQDFSHPL